MAIFTVKPKRNSAVFYGVILLFFSLATTAQENKTPFWNNVRYGGSLGLSFGDGFFSGTIAPSAIYKFNNHVALGLGLTANYNNRKNYYKSTILGGRIIGIFYPINELQLSTEFEELHVNRNWDSSWNTQTETYWYPALFLGAGYRISTGRISTAIGIRYDVLYDGDKSVYADPWMPFISVYF